MHRQSVDATSATCRRPPFAGGGELTSNWNHDLRSMAKFHVIVRRLVACALTASVARCGVQLVLARRLARADERRRTFWVGQRVEARFRGQRRYYKGVISSENGDGTWGVRYDDGDAETAVATEMISAPAQRGQFKVGERVEARFEGKARYYEGKILADNKDGSFEVLYDDGDWEKAATYLRTPVSTLRQGHRHNPQTARLAQCIAWSQKKLDGCEGLGRFDLQEGTMKTLRSIFNSIVLKVNEKNGGHLSPWSGRVGDRRTKCYAFVNGFADGKSVDLKAAGIELRMKQFTGEKAEADEDRNVLASVNLWDCLTDAAGRRGRISRKEVELAISEVATAVQGFVPPRYRHFVTPGGLVALQPNCHNGQEYLPLHLDDPAFEGFGVVIVTIATEGSATIVLEEGGAAANKPTWSFDLKEGAGYFISGFARNQCLHGVLADGSPNRRSLNLRFGLHAVCADDEQVPQLSPQQAAAGHQRLTCFGEVERHW